MTYEIRRGVQKPQPSPKKGAGPEKYPTGKLAVGEYFVVPKAEMRDGETPAKFRNRVNQAVRTYKQRANRERTQDADYNPATFEPMEFSTILLGAPTSEEQTWKEGDVGVWRDA